MEDQRETWKWEKFETIIDSTIGMWFSIRHVNVDGSINLIAPFQQVRRNASKESTYEVFLALGVIGGDEESLEKKRENKGVLRGWENQMM